MSETEARSVAEKVAAARNASNEISEAWLCNMALDGPDDFGYIVRQALDAQAAEIERIQQQLDRSENSAHLLRTQLEGMRQELRDRDQQVIELQRHSPKMLEPTNEELLQARQDYIKKLEKELAEARQEAQEARDRLKVYQTMVCFIQEATESLESYPKANPQELLKSIAWAANAWLGFGVEGLVEPKPETEPGNTFNDCTLIMSDCKEACGQCEALTREEQERAASMEEACARTYKRFLERL